MAPLQEWEKSTVMDMPLSCSGLFGEHALAAMDESSRSSALKAMDRQADRFIPQTLRGAPGSFRTGHRGSLLTCGLRRPFESSVDSRISASQCLEGLHFND